MTLEEVIQKVPMWYTMGESHRKEYWKLLYKAIKEHYKELVPEELYHDSDCDINVYPTDKCCCTCSVRDFNQCREEMLKRIGE